MRIFNWLNPNKKKYGHVISLGYNCEVAYQFFKYYKFVESSLFAWSNTLNINNLIYAIKNLEKLVTGELINIKPMWKCCNTNINFHGKAPTNIWMQNSPLDENLVKQDKTELISRINYLKEKFIFTANDNKKNLYIFKYLVQINESTDVINSNINDLYFALKNKVKNEFDLLVVFDKNGFEKISGIKFPQNVYIRKVDLFAPEDSVTGKIYDRKGWRKIFFEFQPDFKLKKIKHFKFEDI